MPPVVEQRRHARAPVNTPATFSLKGAKTNSECFAKDISIGGMFVETTTPAAFGAEVVIALTLPGAPGPVLLPGVVRWVRDGGMGIQFGNLGAKETHLITEIGKAHGL